MFKPILTFILISISYFLMGMVLSIKSFQNQFFIPTVIILYSTLFLFGIVYVIYLFALYHKKVNQQLKDIQTNAKKKSMHTYDKLYKRFRLFYHLLYLIPISFILYIEFVPKYIDSVDDFDRIKYNPDGHYIIERDLDMTDYEPETGYYKWCLDSYFNGTLDGNNKTLQNLNRTLFFCTREDAVIKDLRLENVMIRARYTEYTGVISNENFGTIDNVHVIGTVIGYENTGGITGSHDRGLIKNSSFAGEVSGLNKVGGLAGSSYNGGEITTSYVKGIISGQDRVGGIIGYGGTIDQSFVTGTVRGRNSIGGIVGFTQSPIADCYTNVEVNSTGWASGGIAGQAWIEIKNSFSLGDVTGRQLVGGITGDSSIKRLFNSFSYGDISSDEGEGSSIISPIRDLSETPPSVSNVYHYENQLINGHQADEGEIVTRQQLLTASWYRDVLQLDEDIWDLSVVEDGYFPRLKHVRDSEVITVE